MEYSDDGQPLTTTLLDYIIPTTLDVPDIVVEHIQTPSTTTLGGMKGAGEGGVIPGPPFRQSRLRPQTLSRRLIQRSRGCR